MHETPLLNSFEWGAGDWGRRPVPRWSEANDATNEHIRYFAIFGLAKVLDDFNIGSFEATKVIEWYWKNSRIWPCKSSQADFNRYARARINDFVGYARRRGDAFHLVDRLFDKSRWSQLSLDEIVDAVAFLTKTQPIPCGIVFEKGGVVFLDLTLRADSPKVLKVDAEFFSILKRLYSFERIDDVVIKHIPVGETATREFSLVKLAWWSQNPQTTFEELEKCIGFRDGDRLNWTRGNLYSTLQDRLEIRASGVPAEFPEFVDANGDTRTVPGQYVELFPSLT